RRRRASRGQLLEDQRGIGTREIGAADLVAHIDAGEAQRRRFAQLSDREYLFLVPARRVWCEFLCCELARRVLDRALLVCELEIHKVAYGAPRGQANAGCPPFPIPPPRGRP